MKSVLVLGATGVMGRRVLALARHRLADARVIAASRSASRVDASARRVDLRETTALPAALEDVDLVVNAVGPYHYDPAPLVAACVETRTHYADLAETPRFLEDVGRTAEAAGAAERGVCIVPGCSTVPGLVQLLASAWSERQDVASLDAWLSLGSRNPVARGLLNGLLAPLGREMPEGGRAFARTTRRPGGPRHLRYGRYPAALPERGLRLGERSVPLRFHVGFDRAWLTRGLRLAAPATARLREPGLRRLAALAMPFATGLRALGTPRGSLVLEAHDADGECLDRIEIQVERGGLDVPASPPVWLAERLRTGAPPRAGLLELSDVVRLGDAVAALREAGHVVRGLP